MDYLDKEGLTHLTEKIKENSNGNIKNLLDGNNIGSLRTVGSREDDGTSGEYSFAEGYGTFAAGTASHAEGYETIASSAYQHVQGKYNIEDADGVYAHIVGNGKTSDFRSNAHTIDWNGNAWYKGDIRVGGTSYDNGNKLLTENDIPTNEKPKLLWTNPNPSSSFSAQTITLNLTNYDVVEVWFKHYYKENYVFNCKTIKGSSRLATYQDRDSAHASRKITVNSDSVYFGSAEFCNTSGSVATENTRMIPLYIVGYETGLFG